MNIIQIGAYPCSPEHIKGGVEASLYGLARELAREHKVDVFDFPRYNESDTIESCGNLSIHRYKNPGKYNQDALSRIKDIVRDIKVLQPDVCHIHGTGMFSGKLYCLLHQCNLPIVVTVHGLQREERKQTLRSNISLKHLYQFILQVHGENKILSSAQKVIADTPYVKEKIESYQFQHQPTITVIPQGVDASYFSVSCNPNSNVIMSVGTICPRKGHAYTIDMFNNLRARGLKAKLRIIGTLVDQNYYNQLLHKSAKSLYREDISIETDVTKEELLSAYSEAKLFVLHSREESQGIVLVEAMATGLPIVATRIGGIPYVVKDNECGYLCSYGDVEGMTDMVEKLLSDSMEWNTFSANAKIFSLQYEWENVSKRVIRFYKE